MADHRDIFPAVKNTRGTFRFRPNRNEELTIQNELEELERKSLKEISANRAMRKQELFSEEHRVTRVLASHFKPEKVKEKRRLEPMFPPDPPLRILKPMNEKLLSPELIFDYGDPYDVDDLLRVTSVVPPNSPSTLGTVTHATAGSSNLADKTPRTKKYPFCKAEFIKTADLTKAHKTSVGVVPVNRDSMEINELRVILEGHPVNTTSDLLEDISMANRCESAPSSDLKGTGQPVSIHEPIPPIQLEKLDQPDGQSKPAILGQTGTTLPVTFSQRQKPPTRPMSKLTTKKKRRAQDVPQDRSRSAKSFQSSLVSGEIILPDRQAFTQYDHAVEEMDIDLENVTTAVSVNTDRTRPVSGTEDRPHSGRHSRPSSSESYKSTRALLEEAKRLTTPQTGKQRKPKRMSKSEKLSPMRERKKSANPRAKSLTSSRDGDANTTSSRPRSERTVDEIITSLRIQSRTGEVSDADRRIQEIMDQVLSRTSAYLGDASETASTSDVQDPNQLDRVSDGSDQSVQSSVQFDTAGAEPDSHPSIEPAEVVESTEAITEPPVDQPEMVEDVEKEDSAADICTDMELDPTALPQVPPPVSESLSDLTSSEVDEHTADIDIQKAWRDLLAAPTATYEDIISISGKVTDLELRQPPQADTTERIPVYSTAVSFLSTWAPVEKKAKVEQPMKTYPEKTIHHFCTATTDYQLPKELQGIGRKYQTPSRYEKNPSQPYRFNNPALSTLTSSREAPTQSLMSEDHVSQSRRQSLAAQRILEEAYAITEEEGDSVELLAQKAEELFAQTELSVEGTEMPIKTDESRLYWTPAPPRLYVPPATVKEKLFPLYEGSSVEEEYAMSHIAAESSDESDEEEAAPLYEILPEDRAARERTLTRLYSSNEDLTNYVKACREREKTMGSGTHDEGMAEAEEEGKAVSEEHVARQSRAPSLPNSITPGDGAGVLNEADDKYLSVSDMGQWLGGGTTPVSDSHSEPVDETVLPIFPTPRRTQSVTKLWDDSEDALIIPNDFSEAMVEIQKMKEKIQELTSGKKSKTKVKGAEMTEEEHGDGYTTVVEEVDPTVEPRVDILQLEKTKQKVVKLTPAEEALQAGRAYVILPKKKKRPKKIDMSRIEAVERFLALPANKLSRSVSRPKLNLVVDRELRVPHHVRSQRRGSLPSLLNFQQYAAHKRKPSAADTREWVRSIWEMWFDQVFPPTPDQSDDEERDTPINEPMDMDSPKPNQEADKKESSTSVKLSDVASVDCLDDSEESEEIKEILMEEVARLTELIESTDKPRAFDIGRRGAIYRKLGKLKKASEDINRAILMEPLLLDAYWHRHLISLVLDKKQAALDDLTFILKHNKSHAGAYRSMAEIFRKQGEITMAIVNYTQAIKMNPEDHEAYTSRAEMYEKRGEMRLALEDYAKATRLQPSKTDAIFKHGMYYFHNENWNSAINDFNDLLKVEPTNSRARMFRGRAYANLGQWNAAVADLSGAIHMDPNNWEAFYHRGCILRRAHPQRALLDFSMSLLIEDSEENIMSYLHRGILYNSLDKPHDAIPDFEAVLKLDGSISSAHINLGLIYMNRFEDYHRAIKKFTAAVKVDPTCVRAFVCRGQCYHKLHDIRNALKDFTRAIHLRPDVHHYYMYRGQLVLEQGNLELAAFCVRHASELGADIGLGQNATQQAVVQTFLKNYDKAVEALMAETRVKPEAPVFMLLGKTQMKAKSLKDAIESFERALALYKPWSKWDSWPLCAAEAHFLIGRCETELRNYTGALEAFNNAIRIDSHHAEAYYQRGLTRIRLKQSKGIQDFNRALAINPNIFQIYLSRACYYGLKGKYAKAILNCNEALKLQPLSVRAYLYRGSLKYHIKAYDLAIRDLSVAATIDNTCALAYFNRAVCYQESKQFEKALTDYGIVLLIGDDLSIKVLINRGLLYFERGDYSNALCDFKMAAKLNPWDYNIHHSLGLCYHKLKQLQESVVAFTKSLVENPFFLEGLVARGNVYMDYGHEEGRTQARSDYQRALMMNPGYLPARVNLAYALQVRGNFMQAWTHFTAALSVSPTYRPALEGRAIVNLQMSDLFAAFQDITAAINVAPSAELLTNRGVINQFMKDGVNAMKDYHLALKKDPTYALGYFNAANIYFHTRHFRQAVDYYNKAIQFNSRDESAYLNRAITKVMLRETQGALEDFKFAIKLSPYSAHVYFNRANLYVSLQKFERAENDYSKALSLKPDDPLVLKRRADVRGKLGMKHEAVEDYRRAIAIQSQSSL